MGNKKYYIAKKYYYSWTPNNDGDPRDATIAGRISLIASPNTKIDDKVDALAGTGGMGVLPIPLVYNGWVQNLPSEWKSLLIEEQQNPTR